MYYFYLMVTKIKYIKNHLKKKRFHFIILNIEFNLLSNGGNVDIGERVKSLRLKNNLTQEELALRCDLSSGFISLLERDLTSPSVDTLVDLLTALGTTVADFFSQKEDLQVVYHKEDVFTNNNQEEGYSITWLVNNAQKNIMEPIYATIEPNSTLFDEDAHVGEEFGYVLQGKVEIRLGEKRFVAKKGDSFYYESRVGHKISNPYNKTAVVIMVSSPPTF